MNHKPKHSPLKITDAMVKAAHKAFHVKWWQLKPGAVCTDTCGKDLEAAG